MTWLNWAGVEFSSWGPGWARRGGKEDWAEAEGHLAGAEVWVPIGSGVSNNHLCLLLPGVLLDIQQHFRVKDRGAGFAAVR